MGIDPKRFKRKKGSIDSATWAEWLADAKPSASAQQELRQKRVEQANAYVPRGVHGAAQGQPLPKDSPAGGVSIHINIPEFRKPQFTRARAKAKAIWQVVRPYITRSRIIVVGVVVLLVVITWSGLAGSKHHSDQKVAKATAKRQTTGTGGKTTPTFAPTVPSTKPELATPDGVHSRFDPNKENYSFHDSINGKAFIVSQQHLASTAVAAQTASAASKSLKTTTEFTTGWGTAYEATNPKYDSQTIVFSVRELLVFIQSSFSLTNDQWTTYINSLQ